MSDQASDPAPSQGRGRGKKRGGVGKYLRARGRGRGRGANFSERLVLEDEEVVELDDEEAKTLHAKYASRGLGSNAHRYEEPEPDPEEEPEPEVDLTTFLERQRREDNDKRTLPGPSNPTHTSTQLNLEDDEVDHDLERLMSSVHLGNNSGAIATNRKNRKEVLQWDEDMEAMQREKLATEAMRDLKTRLQGSTKLKSPNTIAYQRTDKVTEDNRDKKLDDNEAFLDDLLG